MRAAVNVVTALLVLLAACAYKSSEPQRPRGVPGEALWVGGADGGVFVQIREVAGKAGMYRMKLYHGATGENLYTGLAELRPAGTSAVDVHRAESFSGWDGEKMLLSDGRTLVPVGPHLLDPQPF